MQIINGLCINVASVKLIQDLIPDQRIKRIGLGPMKPIGICVHNIGTSSTAAQNTEFVDNAASESAWHFTVGEGVVYQELPITTHGWHAGDGGGGIGNRQYIGIEIQETDLSERTAQLFIKELMDATGITIACVKPHKAFSGKDCPRKILPHWDAFIKGLDPTKQHWAEQHFKYLNDNGIIINEKRFDDTMTRGEAFKLFASIHKGVTNATR